jgi:hypothetical protein
MFAKSAIETAIPNRVVDLIDRAEPRLIRSMHESCSARRAWLKMETPLLKRWNARRESELPSVSTSSKDCCVPKRVFEKTLALEPSLVIPRRLKLEPN